MARFASSALLAALAICATNGRGEIIVGPSGSSSSAPSGKSAAESRASQNRDRARAYQQDAQPSGIVIVAPDEEGILAPRDNSHMQDNRSKAREYQRGNTGPTAPQLLIVPERRDQTQTETPRERLEENRSKARAYMKGESPFSATGDKLPVVSCRDVDSVSGRIGDDAQSGSVITIMRDGRAIKVRCK